MSEEYEPNTPKLVIVRSRVSPESWNRRVNAARSAKKPLERIEELVDAGTSLNAAIAKELPPTRRSWAMRKFGAFRAIGLEALIDARVPREPILAKTFGPLIRAARAANGELKPEAMLNILNEDPEVRRTRTPLPSLSTIRNQFARVDARQRYAAGKRELQAENLPLAGLELLRAAEIQTNAIGVLTDAVMDFGEAAREASKGQTPARDLAHRDARGRFTAKYNQQRRRAEGEKIAGYLKPAAAKGEGRVPSWPRFVHERRKTLEAKLAMVTLSPLVSETKGWNALRATEAGGLASMTGFAYMPSTLAKLTSALAVSGLGERML